MRTEYIDDEDRVVHVSIVARIARVFDFLFGLLYVLLGLRFVLAFFNARGDAGFVRLVDTLSNPFYSPFRNMVGDTVIDGHPIVWSIVIAVVAYMILHAVIRGLLRMLA